MCNLPQGFVSTAINFAILIVGRSTRLSVCLCLSVYLSFSHSCCLPRSHDWIFMKRASNSHPIKSSRYAYFQVTTTASQGSGEVFKAHLIFVVSAVIIYRFRFVVGRDTFHGPLIRYVKLRVAHASGMPGTFFPSPRVRDPDMHHGTCVMHVPWCMPGSLTSGLFWNRWRGKRSRHSRPMRNPQFYVSGKRPMSWQCIALHFPC